MPVLEPAQLTSLGYEPLAEDDPDYYDDSPGTAHASDGAVEVTVDAFGSLHRLWLAPSVANADPSALIVQTSSAAMTAAARSGPAGPAADEDDWSTFDRPDR
ncbi:hypothetical protein [Amycolatopsis saalfeldensis]|uniref:Uncharacterized protein n=1 Tax=Amycolatopsis saalfeldensis TaxID=394193 RepID=A0A1H8Y6P9_9PSEU|nr:hypothetical protein [Amycolatopsis saalfeldensis]SEP47815.1 hypothetical protein SAMN04489732_111218 [Amycolatopsis saalfeldensis]